MWALDIESPGGHADGTTVLAGGTGVLAGLWANLGADVGQAGAGEAHVVLWLLSPWTLVSHEGPVKSPGFAQQSRMKGTQGK